MIDFASEDVRTQFHLLDTELQVNFAEFAKIIAEKGFFIFIDEIRGLNISVRISDQFVN